MIRVQPIPVEAERSQADEPVRLPVVSRKLAARRNRSVAPVSILAGVGALGAIAIVVALIVSSPEAKPEPQPSDVTDAGPMLPAIPDVQPEPGPSPLFVIPEVGTGIKESTLVTVLNNLNAGDDRKLHHSFHHTHLEGEGASKRRAV